MKMTKIKSKLKKTIAFKNILKKSDKTRRMLSKSTENIVILLLGHLKFWNCATDAIRDKV